MGVLQKVSRFKTAFYLVGVPLHFRIRATDNNEANPQMQLTLFEEASTPVEPAASTERLLASSSVVEPELASGQASSVHEDEMTPEQEADFDRNMEFGNFNRIMALGRAGVKQNVEAEPARPNMKPEKTQRRLGARALMANDVGSARAIHRPTIYPNFTKDS